LAAVLTFCTLGPRLSVAYGAEPTGRAEADLKVEADTLMADSKWADAGPVYSKLYAMTQRTGYLWNAAVCKYQLAMAGTASVNEAVALFKQYLGAPDLSDDDVKEAKRCIADLETYEEKKAREIADRAAAERATPAAQPSGAMPAEPTNATQPTVSAPVMVSTSSEGGSGPSRLAAYVVGGISVASIVAGAVFSGISSSKESSVTSAKEFNPSDDSLGETAHKMQYVMYAVGAAGLATAGILYVLSSESSRQSNSTAFHPAVGPGFAGAGISGKF
jgi:hypothetical protein